jgi:steroid 5-alpha reductase family enzyme
MVLTAVLIKTILLIFVYMNLVFVIAHTKKDNSAADVAWGMGFILIAYFTLFKNGLFLPRHLLLTGMITLWGLRLSGHIFLRNMGKTEDQRYRRWRESWGKYVFLRSFLQVFMLQGLLLVIIAYPIVLINISRTQGLNLLDLFGFLVWLIGLIFETVGDYQLYCFLKNPNNIGKILTTGLWSYTRHPNYFGEVLIWWGIFFVTLSVPLGWTAIVSPITITYLLLFVSGIPMTEKLFEGNPAYEEYKKRTNRFFPWFPKHLSK